jgi:hypothetical protein
MPTYFAIHRAGRKIRAWSQVAHVSSHNARERETWNADPEKRQENEVLIGTGDLAVDMKSVMECAGIDPARKRKNGVLAMEFLYTASPDYFTDWKGARDPKRTAEWRDAALKHIKETFGEHRIANATLHLDEKTPHVHVCVVPIHTYQRKLWPPRSKDPSKQRPPQLPKTVTTLSAFSVFGSREQFRARQTAYAEAMKPLGLSRGLSRSKRKHKSMKEFYASEASNRQDFYTAKIKLIKRAKELEDVATSLLNLSMVAGIPGYTPRSVSENAAKILEVLAGADEPPPPGEEEDLEAIDDIMPDLF